MEVKKVNDIAQKLHAIAESHCKKSGEDSLSDGEIQILSAACTQLWFALDAQQRATALAARLRAEVPNDVLLRHPDLCTLFIDIANTLEGKA